MAINSIQFQKGLSLREFLATYGSEAQCEAELERLRWPQGWCCPRCGGQRSSQFRRRTQRYWQCCACRYQSSLRAGTVMDHSQMSLSTWFLAIFLITQSKTNIAALELRRHLGVSWRCAWLLKHKLMEAMRVREQGRRLEGDVRVDDAYLGGERVGGKPGRGSENKVAFVAAVQLREGRPQRLRFDPVAGFSFAALKPWAARAIAPGATVLSDGLIGFEVVRQLGLAHRVVIAPPRKPGTEIEAFRWLNVVLGNLKTALSGTYHAFNFAKYAHRYLAEVQYRFNRRAHLPSLVPRLAVALMRAKPCPRRLIVAVADVGT